MGRSGTLAHLFAPLHLGQRNILTMTPSRKQTSIDYNYFTRDHSPELQAFSDQGTAPVADMTGSGTHQGTRQSTVLSRNPEDDLDSTMIARAEKANEKRDKEDGDYTLGKRKSKSTSETAVTKRQRQAAPQISGSGVSRTTNHADLLDERDEELKAQTASIVERITAIWGTDFPTWPVYGFSPTRTVKSQNGPQKGRDNTGKDEPHDWSLELLQSVEKLASTIGRAHYDDTREILRDLLRPLSTSPGGENSMSPGDVFQAIQRLRLKDSVRENRRSPTFAAPMSDHMNDGDQDAQIDGDSRPRDSPLMADEHHGSPQRERAPNACGVLSLDHAFVESFIYKNDARCCNKFIEIFQDILAEKERHEAALKQHARRWHTEMPSRE